MFEKSVLIKENKDLKTEIANLKSQNTKTSNIFDEITRELLELQDINNLGINEESKNQHRNVIINRLIDMTLNNNRTIYDHGK